MLLNIKGKQNFNILILNKKKKIIEKLKFLKD